MTTPQKQCTHIKKDGTQCKNTTKDQKDLCWVHENPQLHIQKSQPAKIGGQNPHMIHGLHSDILHMPCTERCFMYDICEVKTDDPTGQELYGGVCYYEVNTQFATQDLVDMNGLKSFMADHLMKLNNRINRGTRFELVTGGFLSEPEISAMQRNVSAVGFGLMQILEKEQLAALNSEIGELKEVYEKYIKDKLGVNL